MEFPVLLCIAVNTSGERAVSSASSMASSRLTKCMGFDNVFVQKMQAMYQCIPLTRQHVLFDERGYIMDEWRVKMRACSFLTLIVKEMAVPICSKNMA